MIGWGPLESLVAAGGTLLGAFVLFAKNQRDKGRTEEKIMNLDTKLNSDVTARLREHDVALTAHATALAKHDTSLEVIDTKLDNLKEGQTEIKKAVEKIATKLEDK
jgi:hypothetical protein